jgi:polar amino acid transport system substrate-binding protein
VAKTAEPFAFESHGDASGYSVDLWRRVAKEAGLDFDIKMVKIVPEVLNAIQKGEADVGLGALSITEDREKVMDFTLPFFDESGLQIMAHGRSSGSAFAAFGSLLHGGTLMVVAIMLGILFVVSNLLWLGERKKNQESFPEPYKQGLFEALWWCVSTMLTGGCENLAPRGLAGRAVGVVWMIGGTDLQIVGPIFEKQAYGFALPLGSPLRKRLNTALLKGDVQQYREELDKRWFAAEKGTGK